MIEIAVADCGDHAHAQLGLIFADQGSWPIIERERPHRLFEREALAQRDIAVGGVGRSQRLFEREAENMAERQI